ncbi:DUF6689 family protein [Kangiella spongicola]|jgi:hypothetical protein|uniref:Uncharacterized protein n=1 Tax=Kangiella spongicola TaxID=796379 RepID=A0A318D1Q7_9GAMM|nr:DUF6689 family protein [Kangiella spongicola]MBV36486.1 hypothetical protein [Rickettsiales bacterium]PXF62743.1 hypothetical protein DL796_10480 [Kangiella spongicola]
MMTNFLSRLAVTISALCFFASAQGSPVELTVNGGNKIEAVIELAGGIEADFTISFENVIGLNEESIGLSAEVVDITDLNLLNRLPSVLDTNLLSAFPMLITVEPLSSQGLSFEGLVTVDIHTHNLEYTAGTPLRLFKAPLGGEFKDITMTMGSGSYRARGTTGKFSQFLILADLRLPTTVVNTKMSNLATNLSNFSTQMSAATYTALSAKLNEVQQLIAVQNYTQASDKLNEFKQIVEAARGLDIPDVWRSSRDIDNVAGELMALANTLRFSLRLIN